MTPLEAITDAIGPYLRRPQAVLDTLHEHDYVIVHLPPGSRVVVDRATKRCPHCKGTGGDSFCNACGGSGVVEATSTYGLAPVSESEDGITVFERAPGDWVVASATAYHLVALPEETPHA